MAVEQGAGQAGKGQKKGTAGENKAGPKAGPAGKGQKKNSKGPGRPQGRFGEEPEDTDAKALKDARIDAEQRFRKILERRNALNDEGRQARDARDAINGERQRIYGECQVMLGQRQALGQEIRALKQVRNEAQGRARQLIGLKQEKRKGAVGGAGQRVRELDGAIKALEFKQQTVPMSGPKELELLDEIRDKLKELEEAKKVKASQDLIFGEVKDLDAAINEAFAKADAEHAKIVELSNAWQELTDKLDPAFQKLEHLKAEADKRHQESVDFRTRANEEHARADALKGELDSKREDVEKFYAERREVLQNLKQQVRALDDPEAKEASAEEAIRLLREKGRISL